jgi:hypothetical protein
VVAAYNRPGTAPIVADRDDRDIRQAKEPRYLHAEDDATATPPYCRSHDRLHRRDAQGQESAMGTHVYGLTVSLLSDASRAARTVDHAVTLLDHATHTIVVIDQRGRVTVRPDDTRPR